MNDNLTTAIGSALGTVGYINTVGFQVPQNRNDWIAFGINAAIAIFGLLVKR